MDGEVRKELARVIQQEGIGLSENPQRIKALLMDTRPESRTEISLIVAAAEDEIPLRLARSSESVFRDSEIFRAISDLKRTRRLDEGAAAWVVNSWASVLGLGPEPSDDVADTASADPTFGPAADGPRGSTASTEASSGESPPWSAPRGAGPTWSRGSGGSSVPPGPNSAPPSGPMSGGGPTAPSTSNPQRVWAPGPGRPPESGWSDGPGGPPPPGVAWQQDPTPPPPERRGRLIAILAAVVAVVVFVVVGVVFLRPAGTPVTPPATQPPSAPPAASSTPPSPANVDIGITDSIGNWQIAETVAVYSFGEKVGELGVSRSQPTDRIQLSAPPGQADYQLRATMILNDSSQTQVTLTGSGQITVFAGAEYQVVITQDSAGNYIASLEAGTGGS